jgi:hypothetical protein
MAEQSDPVRRLIEDGAEIAGGTIAGALGFLAAGPIGAAALGGGGAAAVVALRRVGAEVGERLLARRERVRLGGVLALTAATIQDRSRRGESLRQDGFFEQKPGGRSDAEEVAESVLLKSQREPEERKLPYLAGLLANVAFDANISAEMAHQLIKVAEQLTYRQLCLLKIAAIKQSLSLRASDYRGHTAFAKTLYQVLYECFDLYQRKFVSFGGDVAFGPTDVKPSNMTLQGLGVDLFNLMGLRWIPDLDLAPVVAQLT